MTANQRIFADEYLKDRNATRAYMAAYRKIKDAETAAAGASRLLTNVKVSAYINEKLEAMSSAAIADAREVMEYLTAVMRGESRASVLARDMTGADHVIDKPPDERERTRAAELLGKRYGLFADQVRLSGPVPVIIDDTDSHDGGHD